MEIVLKGIGNVQHEIMEIEAELQLASMRKELLRRSCSVDVINIAWNIKKSLKEYRNDKRF